jgi:DNA ligase D-like protein (predicted ligase)
MRFIEPMECLSVAKAPSGPEWTYEIKLDGYRMEVVRSAEGVVLYTRRKKVVTGFPEIAAALAFLPPGTILDGEVQALDSSGRPNFSLLQNHRSADVHIVFFVFDIMAQSGFDVTGLPLAQRRNLLRSVVQPNDHVAICEFSTSAEKMLAFIKANHLEGIVAKRADSLYEPGGRSGAWTKTRVLMGQEMVVGGYTPSHLGVDALIVGFYDGTKLRYAGRVRAGFTPRTRRLVFDQIKQYETPQCPFANLPEKKAGVWGQGLTAAKMQQCRWLKPEVVAQIEFLEWTPGDHVRHASFVGLRDDKKAQQVVKET